LAVATLKKIDPTSSKGDIVSFLPFSEKAGYAFFLEAIGGSISSRYRISIRKKRLTITLKK
jgi:hypothetical protein